MNLKRVALAVTVGAVLIYSIRIYGLYMAVNSFEFGCETAAKKMSQADVLQGGYLYSFCEAYTRHIREEFNR